MSELARLKFLVPEASEYGYDSAGKINLVISAVDGVLSFFEDAVIGTSIGFGAMMVTGPLAAWANSYIGLGEGYAAARKTIADDNIARGFSRAAVMAFHERTGRTVVRYFGHEYFSNTFDQEAAVIARNAFASGLLAGYKQGSECSQGQKQLLLQDLKTRTGLRWGQLEHDNERAAIMWYVEMAAAFRRAHLRE